MVSLGGTKNGALGAEAIVVLNREAVSGVGFLRKIDMQLASKMRFVSAQLLALYSRRPVASVRDAGERDGATAA